MKLIAGFLIALCFISCAPLKPGQLKGKYNDPPYVIISEKSKDQVWDNIIDLFAQTGIGIRIIDRSSGLIISNERTSLTVTYEKKNGELKDPTAYIVAASLVKPGSPTYYPAISASGEWNIRIKEQDGKTLINVNLLNIRVEYPPMLNPVAGTYTDKYEKSGTGITKSLFNFEKMIAGIVK